MSGNAARHVCFTRRSQVRVMTWPLIQGAGSRGTSKQHCGTGNWGCLLCSITDLSWPIHQKKQHPLHWDARGATQTPGRVSPCYVLLLSFKIKGPLLWACFDYTLLSMAKAQPRHGDVGLGDRTWNLPVRSFFYIWQKGQFPNTRGVWSTCPWT